MSTITKLFTSILKYKIERQLQITPPEYRISSNKLGCKRKSLASKEGLYKNYIIWKIDLAIECCK